MKSFLNVSNSQVKLAKEIIEEFPIKFGNYYEPFLDTGNVFFNLYNYKRIFGKAFLSSTDARLIRAYTAVRDDPSRVARVLQRLCEKNSKELFEANLRTLESPASYIYCSRASNSFGTWNHSEYVIHRQKMSCDIKSVERCSKYINKWCDRIINVPYGSLLPLCSNEDLVYYHPKPFERYHAHYINGLKIAKGCTIAAVLPKGEGIDLILGKPRKRLYNGLYLWII